MDSTLHQFSKGIVTCALFSAVLAGGLTTTQGQTITLTLEEVTPVSGKYCFDHGTHDRQINVLMSQTGIAADSDTMGSATIDVEFDNTLWSWKEPVLFEPIPTDLIQTPAVIYTVAFVNNIAGQVRVTILPATNLAFVEALGTEIGGAPVGLVRGLCFDSIPPAAAAKTSAAIGNQVNIIPSSLSAGLFTPPILKGTILACSGDSDSAPYGLCVINNISGGNLPVELSSLQAITDNEGIVLSWTTESEFNNAGFSIEHARGDDTEFSELAFLEGHGTTTEAQTYEFRSTGLDIGRHRFRLRQIDFDGAFEYSEEVEAVIELAGTHRLGAAYPNPFNPSTTFELIVGKEQQVQIDVINALGQRVQRMFDGPMEANEPKNFVFNARMLPTGLYFYRVVGENFAQTRQMLLVK